MKRILDKFAYGALIYWGLNVLLLAQEPHFHLIGRLFTFDCTLLLGHPCL